MTAIAGGNNIRCSPYATFGTKKLSKLAVTALRSRLACLLAHHGQIALGRNLKIAMQIAIEIETLAHIYLKACQLGEHKRFIQEEMNCVIEKFKKMNYGRYK